MKLIGKLVIVFVAVLIITILTRLLFNFLFGLIHAEWAQSLLAEVICYGIAAILSFFVFVSLDTHHFGILLLSFIVSMAAVYVATRILGEPIRSAIIFMAVYVLNSIKNFVEQ